jgi:hypothetical protein
MGIERKHIGSKFREHLDAEVDVDHVGTDEQLADILAKALGCPEFVELHQKIGVHQTSGRRFEGEKCCSNPVVLLRILLEFKFGNNMNLKVSFSTVAFHVQLVFCAPALSCGSSAAWSGRGIA